MGARNFNSFGKSFKLFLMIDFLILILSFIGTAQFANECYQLMSFAGFAALLHGFFLSCIVLCPLLYLFCWGLCCGEENSILAVIAFFIQILIRLPSCFFRILDGYAPHSLHDIIVFAQVGMGIIGLAYLFLRYIRTRTQPDDTLKIDFRQGAS